MIGREAIIAIHKATSVGRCLKGFQPDLIRNSRRKGPRDTEPQVVTAVDR